MVLIRTSLCLVDVLLMALSRLIRVGHVTIYGATQQLFCAAPFFDQVFKEMAANAAKVYSGGSVGTTELKNQEISIRRQPRS